MTVNLYDGNNLLLRAMTTLPLPGQRPMTLRMRYEEALAAPAGSQIWCFDGFDHNARRRAIYPGYKANRPPMAEDLFSQIRLFRELLTCSNAIQIEVPTYEADDVVGTMARNFAKRGTPVCVHTNDLDYHQLASLPNVTINGIKKAPCPPRWIALYKAFVGDKSDEITGIPGFGPKAWEAVTDYLPQLEAAVASGSIRDFDGIPFKPAVRTWLTAPGNIEHLQSMLLITHFITVPDEEINKSIVFGRPRPDTAAEILRRYFL